MENEIVLFETEDHEIKLNVAVENNTVWLNRKQLAELFGRDVKTIGKHINNALKEELDNSVVANFATTASDGKVYQVEHYNLDMIISVGYRVKSRRGVEFRRWANDILKQYILDNQIEELYNDVQIVSYDINNNFEPTILDTIDICLESLHDSTQESSQCKKLLNEVRSHIVGDKYTYYQTLILDKEDF